MSTPVRRAIYGALTSSGQLLGLLGAPAPGFTQSIYHDQAPDNAGFPFVVLSKSSGVPTEAFHDPSALETDVWLVKAIARANDMPAPSQSASDRAEMIADTIKTLLNDYPLSISGATCLYLRRESDVEYAELADGVVYRHCGSLYRLITTD